MPGSWPQHELPFLTEDCCEITSKSSNRYNCIAWAAKDNLSNWWPDEWDVGYWPEGVPRVLTVTAFMQAYGTLGYQLCYDGKLEQGLEKIAIFAIEEKGVEVPTHAALQLESGKWSSKLGPFEDVCHDMPDDVRGPVYGKLMCFMARPRQNA